MSGWVRFSIAGDLRVPGSGKIIGASSRTVQLVGGKGQIRVPTVSSAVVDDAGDAWVIIVQKSWLSQPYGIRVPAGTTAINLADLPPARPLTSRETSWVLTGASVDVQTLPADQPAGGSVALEGGTLRFDLRIPKGEQGLPGPGAVAADDAVANYVQTTSKTRTALEKVYRRGYSPREFGVVGDGVADDTAAWNALVAAVPAGAVVTCPEGDRYKLTGPITVSKALTVEGGEFLPRDTGTCIQISASDVTLRGVKFTSATASPPEATHRIINAVGTPSARLRNITVENCTIDKTRYIGIWLEWCEDVTVTGNRITDFQYGAIMFLSTSRGEASSNIIRNGLQEGTIPNTYGIAATDLVNSVAGRSKDILITRNVIDNIPRWEGIDTHGGERITITDNMVTRCYDGISAVVGNASRVTAPKDIIISGNIIDSMGITGPRSGIRFYGKTDGDRANGAITSNIVRGYVMDVEASQYDTHGTTITSQATTITNGYSSHPAPFRQYFLSSRWAVASSGTATVTRNFPEGTFTTPPLVLLTPQSAVAGWTFQVTDVTTTSVTITGQGPAVTFDIQMGIYAIQMGTAAAGGVPRS